MNDNKNLKKRGIWSIKVEGATRIESLAEGVLAVAMTLLILVLSNNELFMEVLSAGRIFEISGQIIGYVTGFLIIGVYWTIHHYMFHYIKKNQMEY